ncbi:UNVERIFIED_CONTAM: hypothetical protein HHA_239660 [Hammondia hammondi]|eukprot:XP_008887747.1 hypothetical protein HHA_239660 [Hammondia hammondi]
MKRAIHWGGNFSWLPFVWQTECRRTRGFGDLCGAYCCLTKFLMFPEVAILPTEKLDRSSSCMEELTDGNLDALFACMVRYHKWGTEGEINLPTASSLDIFLAKRRQRLRESFTEHEHDVSGGTGRTSPGLPAASFGEKEITAYPMQSPSGHTLGLKTTQRPPEDVVTSDSACLSVTADAVNNHGLCTAVSPVEKRCLDSLENVFAKSFPQEDRRALRRLIQGDDTFVFSLPVEGHSILTAALGKQLNQSVPDNRYKRCLREFVFA